MKKILSTAIQVLPIPLWIIGIGIVTQMQGVGWWAAPAYALIACMATLNLTVEWRDKRHFQTQNAITNHFLGLINRSVEKYPSASDVTAERSAVGPSDFAD